MGSVSCSSVSNRGGGGFVPWSMVKMDILGSISLSNLDFNHDNDHCMVKILTI